MATFHAELDLRAGVLEKVRRLLRGAPARVANHRMTLGIHEDQGAESKFDYHGKPTSETLAEVAWFHEFKGDRSFLRSWFDANEARFRTELLDASRAEFSGDKEAVAELGRKWATELHDWIASATAGLRALTDYTVREKTAANLSSPETPLFATGQLLAAMKARLDGADA